jgi:hypothetical protein
MLTCGIPWNIVVSRGVQRRYVVARGHRGVGFEPTAGCIKEAVLVDAVPVGRGLLGKSVAN